MTASEPLLSRLRNGQLAGTSRLDLRNAGLREFPREIFALAETLETLDLSGNELDALPDDLHALHRLRILFCSNNRFTALPAALGRCAQLDIAGFKANAIEDIPDDSLPASLRWLILTDNRIAALPPALMRCTGMQKLMLAGNRLSAWPAGMGAWQRLELLRVSANRFETVEAALPEDLLALPRLTWLAFAGNPFNDALEARATHEQPIARIAWSDLRIGELLGEGASGLIHAAQWQRPNPAGKQGSQSSQTEFPLGGPLNVAVKRFKGAVTSDGLPASEMAACMTAGAHPHLVGLEGQIADHPDGAAGLVMRRIPGGYRNLAGPPSLDSCTRDVYPDGLRLTAAQARAIALGVAQALAHLHARGLIHGDLYAHNILVDDACHPLLGDFGAASFQPDDDAPRAASLRRLDRRALAVLVDELAQRCDDPTALAELRPAA